MTHGNGVPQQPLGSTATQEGWVGIDTKELSIMEMLGSVPRVACDGAGYIVDSKEIEDEFGVEEVRRFAALWKRIKSGEQFSEPYCNEWPLRSLLLRSSGRGGTPVAADEGSAEGRVSRHEEVS